MQGGRKSFTFDELDKTYRVQLKKEVYVHFLEALQLDIISRENKESNTDNTGMKEAGTTLGAG